MTSSIHKAHASLLSPGLSCLAVTNTEGETENLPYKITNKKSIKINRYGLRWLVTVFRGQYLPSLSINFLRRHKQRFGEIATTVVLDKDEHLLWLGLQWHRSCRSNEMTPLPILLQQYFLALGSVLPKPFTGALSSNSRLGVREV